MNPAFPEGLLPLAAPNPAGGYSGIVSDFRGNVIFRVEHAAGSGSGRGQASYRTAAIARRVAADFLSRPEGAEEAGRILRRTKKARR